MSLSNSYAQALYLSTKETDAKQLEVLEAQLDQFLALLDREPTLKKVLFGPLANVAEKGNILSAIAVKTGDAKILTNFLVLLARKNRLSSIASIREAFSEVRLEAEGGVSGRLVTADPITEKDVQDLAGAFGRKLGKKVEFRVSTDPSLLAGAQVTVNGVTYDGSLKSQLRRLRDSVMAGHTV